MDPDRGSPVPAVFATTHWSLVLTAGDRNSNQSSAALEELCTAYWYPLYAYLRRWGHSHEDAADLTQGFFAKVLGSDTLAQADRERGRFRTFLLTGLKRFVAHEWERSRRQKRGGGQSLISFEELAGAERYAAEPADNATPDALYQRRWAETLLARALDRVRSEYAANGRAALFDLLKPYVWGEESRASYPEIAAHLDLNEGAVRTAVSRLRTRFAQALRAEVAQTVAAPGDVEDELREFLRSLAS